MIYISHRGNLSGKNTHTENTWNQIEKCLTLNYDVEIDVWFINQRFYLGHDKPTEPINIEKLMNSKLWCHAKNHDAIFEMLKYKNIHCFWHENDKYTITSNKILWSFPGEPIDFNTVCVLPELTNFSMIYLQQSYGICSDNITYYYKLLNTPL